MAQDVTIRPVSDDELEAVSSLMVEAYGEFAARMSPDAWSSFARDIADVAARLEEGEVLVAERGGETVGAVTLYLDWRGAQPDAGAVRSLAVPPRHRGTGVGHALLSHCVERCREAGKHRVVIALSPEMTAQRDVCAELGFVRDPDLDHEPAPGVHVLGYVLRL